MADPTHYPLSQRTIDRAVLWSFSRLLAAALWLAARIRRTPGASPGAF